LHRPERQVVPDRDPQGHALQGLSAQKKAPGSGCCRPGGLLMRRRVPTARAQSPSRGVSWAGGSCGEGGCAGVSWDGAACGADEPVPAELCTADSCAAGSCGVGSCGARSCDAEGCAGAVFAPGTSAEKAERRSAPSVPPCTGAGCVRVSAAKCSALARSSPRSGAGSRPTRYSSVALTKAISG